MDIIFEAIHLLARNIAYQFRLEGIINIFNSEMEKLISIRNLVLDEVEATNNKKEKINDTVLEWLNDAEKLMEEITKMEIEIETNSNGYFLRIFSAEKNCQLYDQMQKKIKLLYTKCEFEQFFTPIPSIEYFSSGYFVSFKSTKEASDQLLEALKDDSSYIIGLHGMQGSGKTKLVKAVGEKAKFLKLFDAVVFVTASRYRNLVWWIQDKIDDCFDLILDSDDEDVRARSISSKLQQSEERILVILDDVQARFELEDIGIPYNSNRCKVLLTTCHQQICTLMDCEREIPLHPLSEEEAWKLFKKHSAIDKENNESSSSLLEVARRVATECEGLPAKIKDVGSSLRRKPFEEWEATLENLRHPWDLYQVFLSFRGQDTRYSFTGFLYDALCREEFKTFMDDKGLEGGDQISLSIIAAIEASWLSIIVLSENYAYSSWCLDELVTILDCKKTKNQLVLPVFYKMDPTDVRYQRNSYSKAMEAHEKRFGKDSEKVRTWRSALFEVAGLSGDHYTSGTEYEYQFIQKIVGKVNNNKRQLVYTEYGYGLEGNHNFPLR